MTRSCARRSLAAETIFMALVICCVLRTERMRRRMSIRLGMRFNGRMFGDETFLEFFDDGGDLAAQGVVEGFLFHNLGQQGAVRVVDEAVELFFELTHLFNRKIVQVALCTGEDDEDLL